MVLQRESQLKKRQWESARGYTKATAKAPKKTSAEMRENESLFVSTGKDSRL